jgi:putative tricarboxylic transport membrane protein
MVGLFAVSEVLLTMEELAGGQVVIQKFSGSLPTIREYLGTHMAMLRGTLIGFIVGIVPGAGKAVASFIAYNEERRASKHPERFGTGVLEGVAAPEAANNAVVGGALVPLLSLGIPGSAAAAVLIGAFTIQGLQPGPLLFVKEPGLVYGLFASLLVGNLVMLAMGLLGTKLWAKVLDVPKNVLTPMVLAVTLFAAYAESNNVYTVWLALAFGVLGYVMRKCEFPVAPVVLAIVLGNMIEISFRRSLILSDGSISIFFSRPVALLILGLAAVSIGYQILRDLRKKPRVSDE